MRKIKETEMIKRRNEVVDLYCKGRPVYMIAEQMGVTRATIWNDVQAVKKALMEQASDKIDEMRYDELMKVNKLEITYWDSWEKSIEDHIRKSVKEKSGEIEKSVIESASYGDPRFLQGIERCIERRCKLLGLDAPEKVQQDTLFRVIIENYDRGQGSIKD